MSVLRSNGIEREIFISRTRFLTNSINTLGTNSAYFPLRLALPFDLSNQTGKVGTFFVMPKKCTRCQQVKDESEFHKRSIKKGYLMSWCKSCWSDYNKERGQTESYKEAERAWQKKYADKAEVKAKRSRRESQRIRTLRESNRQGWQEYLKKISEYRRTRWATDPIYVAKETARALNRKAQKYQGGSFTEQEWLDLCARYDYRCLCCKEQKPLTVDHVMPLSKGGSNDIGNIQPLCGSCNSSKRDRHIDYRPA